MIITFTFSPTKASLHLPISNSLSLTKRKQAGNLRILKCWWWHIVTTFSKTRASEWNGGKEHMKNYAIVEGESDCIRVRLLLTSVALFVEVKEEMKANRMAYVHTQHCRASITFHFRFSFSITFEAMKKY